MNQLLNKYRDQVKLYLGDIRVIFLKKHLESDASPSINPFVDQVCSIFERKIKEII